MGGTGTAATPAAAFDDRPLYGSLLTRAEVCLDGLAVEGGVVVEPSCGGPPPPPVDDSVAIIPKKKRCWREELIYFVERPTKQRRGVIIWKVLL